MSTRAARRALGKRATRRRSRDVVRRCVELCAGGVSVGKIAELTKLDPELVNTILDEVAQLVIEEHADIAPSGEGGNV